MKNFRLWLVCVALFLSFIPPKKKFIDPANMDQSVKPGDNFYQYANGNWMKNNPVPASKTRWGSFDELREQSSQRLKLLLESAASHADADTALRKLGYFYTSAMDSAAIEAKGMQPIQADLDSINKLNSIRDVLREMATQRVAGTGDPLFGFGIEQDAKNVTQYIPQFYQGGLSLPDRDYYFKDDPRSATIREAYVKHLMSMFQLAGAGSAEASKQADAVMRIETALAKAQMSRVEMRDPYKTYNKFKVSDFSASTPAIDWAAMLQQLQLQGQTDSVLVNNPGFFKAADILLTALPLNDWKSYLSWQVIDNAAPYLSSAFVKEDFSFARVLTGQKEQTPRWQRMSYMLDRQMGDELGKLYVAAYFKPEAKERMLDLVNNLQQTFAGRIEKLDWMSADTKKQALEKLNAFTKKIAYPDKWKNYASLSVTKDDLLGNVRRADAWNYRQMLDRFGKPVDKSRWAMTPPTVNAYYSSINNEIVFPAGILQFPFFDFAADDAVNYGGIAAVIGHEMSHGFDDRGRQSAADGTLRDWWTAADASQFKQRADKVVAQYDALTVQDSIHVNGRLTLGENIADLGGLAMAYEAFTHTKQFREGKKIDGFTPAQRFFLSWAQVWRNNILPETEAQNIIVDPHSPGVHRANDPVSNIDAWYEAFGVREGDKMFRPVNERVKVW